MIEWLGQISFKFFHFIYTLSIDFLPWLIGGIVINGSLRYWLSPKIFYINTTGDPIKDAELWKRAQTFSEVFKRSGSVAIWIFVFIMALRGIGVDMGPLFASFGIAGIAVGFGAQSLVRDVLGGIFILLENHYNLGDLVEIAEIKGRVQEINLRTTVLRDLRGTVHTIPNGVITTVSNKTKHWSQVVLDIPISPDEDIDRAMEVIYKIGQELLVDENFKSALLAEPKILGVQEIRKNEIIVRSLIKTKPDRQRVIQRVMQKKVKQAFDTHGIKMAKYDLAVDQLNSNNN